MNRVFGIVVAMVLMLAAGSQSAQAIGAYADVPMSYTFSDCTVDCTKKPSGLKAGVLFGGFGVGLEDYKMSDATSSVKFSMLDVSYLLPIPIINLTGGVGFGNVNLETTSGAGLSGTAGQYWVSLGMTILAVVDLHVGYHKVTAAVHNGPFTANLGGKMMSVGAMINF